MDWLLLALLSAFSLASADALTKLKLAHRAALELVLVRFGATALVMLPLLVTQPWPSPPVAFWGWVGILLPLEILAMLFYMQAIRQSPLALTLPYLAFTPVFTSITAWLILGEHISPRGMGGISLVIAGAYLLNLPSDLKALRGQWLDPLRAIGRERGSRLMLLVAILYGITSVLGKRALDYVDPLFFGPFYFVVLGVVTGALVLLRRGGRWPTVSRSSGWPLMVGLLMATMVVSHFLAIERVEAAYMIAVKRVSLLFGIVYGALLFKEQRLGPHLMAGAIMIGGVVVLARS